MSTITYRQGNDIDLDAFIGVYRASTLGERRPVDNREIMRAMLEHANLLITAWDDEKLIGLSRTLTDFSYVAYLACLAVDEAYQGQGIGRELVKRTREALEPTAFLTLLAAPKANDYYPRIGFDHHPRAWTLPPRKRPE